MPTSQFERLASGDQTFLIRSDGTDYQPGDLLRFRDRDSLFVRVLWREVGVVAAGVVGALAAGTVAGVARLDLGDKVILSLKPAPGHTYPHPDPPAPAGAADHSGHVHVDARDAAA